MKARKHFVGSRFGVQWWSLKTIRHTDDGTCRRPRSNIQPCVQSSLRKDSERLSRTFFMAERFGHGSVREEQDSHGRTCNDFSHMSTRALLDFPSQGSHCRKCPENPCIPLKTTISTVLIFRYPHVIPPNPNKEGTHKEPGGLV